MASIKYILICPFVFLCLSCTFANRVFNSNDGFGLSPEAGPIPGSSAGPKASPIIVNEINNVGTSSKVKPKASPIIVNGVSNAWSGPKASSNVGTSSKVKPKASPIIVNGVSNAWSGPKASPIIVNGASSGWSGPKAGPKSSPIVMNEASNVGFGPKVGPKASPIVVNGANNIKASLVSELRVDPKSDGGISNIRFGPKIGPKASPIVVNEVSNAGAGPTTSQGVDPIINGIGVGVGVGVGYRPGFGFGSGTGRYWPGPIVDPYNDCMLGYVCPSNNGGKCSKFEYGTCESYNFHPLTTSMDLHEVDINWAKSKHIPTAQHDQSGPAVHIGSAH